MWSGLDRFTILQRLGTGGMAEVFKCRQSGIGGFEKLVVIKRILPHLVEDESFVSMFLDEGRIAANLSHPNIVQVFEIAMDPRGVPYIVMEYVRGPSLQQLIRAALKAQRLDLRHMVRLIEGASRGLHHAHHARDAEGQPLNIIHRDISLQNILVTLEGLAKLADFGVARANGRITHTQSGIVKGKVRYTAPEVLVDPDNAVHARSDVFGLGVCLYVATTGQHPFNGATDLAVMEAIHAGRSLPPAAHVPDYPEPLAEIVAWLLEPNPSQRCPSALAAAERLAAWLASTPGSTEAALGPWVAGLCPELTGDAPPPPTPDERATPEDVPESIDILLSDATGTSLGQRKSNRRWAFTAVTVLTVALGGAWTLARQQANEAAREVAERRNWLDEAERQLDAGRFLHAQELLRRGAAVPNPRTDDELRVARLEADLTFERSLAAAHAAFQSGDRESAVALLQTLSSLEPGDERTLRLSRELKAVEAAPPVVEAREGGDAGALLPSARAASRDAGSQTPPRVTRRPVVEAAPPPVEPVEEAAAPEAPPEQEEVKPPPPPPRARAALQRTPREGRPGLRITASVRAQVFLDGLPIGWTPLEVQEVAPTTHLVMAWAEGYESLTERVVVSHGEHVALDFPLRTAAP